MGFKVTSAQVVPSEKLTGVRFDPKIFVRETSNCAQYVLMIVEPETKCIRVIHLDQEFVTKLAIEVDYFTPELLRELFSIFDKHKISLIYSTCQNIHPWSSKFRLEVYIREIDVAALCLDLEQIDTITKMELLTLCASD
ncbi:MAG: hypothetical protein ACE5R6_03735 [Candidatus Heimdallarchaeota archaeon]